MTTASRFRQLLKKQIEGIPALVGLPTSETTYVVNVPNGRPSEIYVRLNGDTNRVVAALNHSVSPYANLPVRVRVNTSGLYEIIGVDGLQAETFAGAATGSLNVPTLIGSLIPTTWESSQFAPAKIRAANEGQDLFVYMNPAVYGSAVIGNVYLDLSTAVASITAGEKALILISVDPTANTLSATVGVSVSLAEPIHLADTVSVTSPSGDIRLAAYIIQAGATVLPTTALAIDGNYYYDLRTFIGIPTASSGGSSQWIGAQFNHYDFYATVGTVATQALYGQTYPYMVYNPSNTNGDTLKIITHMAAGDYEAKILAYKDNNRAIMDIKVNGSVNTSVDMYSASAVYNHEITITFTIASNGEQTFEFVVNGKNASSSGYFLTITRMWVYPS